MEKWSEIRSAYLVAKLGTVSAAAEVLGVHRATVNRHIDALEEVFGTTLFLRHARGYTPTDAGSDMLETAGRVEEMFTALAGRNQGRSSHLSGELIVSTLPGVASLIMPAIAQFREAYPEVELRFAADSRLARLEHGEAHIAVRAGPKPEELDYVIIPFLDVRFALYAHSNYIARYGRPSGINELSEHWFVGSLSKEQQRPYASWMQSHIKPSAIALDAQHPQVILHGLLAGLGLGFLAEHEAVMYKDLVCIVPPQESWVANLWIVTHIDLHRTFKVQEFLRLLKELSRP